MLLIKINLLLCILFLSCNTSPTRTTCFKQHQFEALITLLQTKGVTIALSQRLVVNKEIHTKELSISNFYLELQKRQKDTIIIIIDKDKTIPTYSAKLTEDKIDLDAYASRFDTTKDKEARRENWCKLANLALQQNQ